MKILYALNSSQPGGMEHHVLDLVESMVNLGHTVYVWLPEGPLVSDFEKLGAKVTLKYIKYECDFAYISALIKFIKENKVEVVHGHEIKAVMNALFAAWLAGVKARVGHTHTPISEWNLTGLLGIKKYVNLFFYFIFINLFVSCEIALTPSRKEIKKKEGISTNKLVVIPNCVRMSKFAYSSEQRSSFRNEILTKYEMPLDAIVFGNVSRISEEKGHKILIDAFDDFCSRVAHSDKYYLLLAGGGPLEADLKAYIKTKKFCARMIVTGRFEAELNAKFFATFDLFVHPTLAEGFGIVIIEAMSACIPIICSDLPVLKEVAQDHVMYFKKGDSQDLSEKLFDFTMHEQLYKSKTSSAYDLVKNNYTLELFAQNYQNLYKRLLTNQ